MISVELKTIFNLLYDAICIFIVLVIANLLALNYFFYEKYLMLGGWCNNLIKLLLGAFLVGLIIVLLFCFEKHDKSITPKNRYSYLFFCIIQGCVFYPQSVSVLFECNLNNNEGLSAILAILSNIIISFVFASILIISRRIRMLSYKASSILLKVYIIILLILIAVLTDNSIGGNYIALVNDAVLLYYFICLRNDFFIKSQRVPKREVS